MKITIIPKFQLNKLLDFCTKSLCNASDFADEMKKQGIDLIDCSSGGVVPAKVNSYPGYQVPRCETIKSETAIATGAVGKITTGSQAEEILQNERADMVLIGRALLRNPYWAKASADELGYAIEAPVQYERGWG
ncbi:NADPH2 dehydrogenase [Virgibacillus natechei]|uniref:NADPH2 dehydrogenase n=1 Tax=Virgibacillus natechei TaxID=1216297 RepID=A0ABS4IBJ4_9BACI|nr:NADPH2 dehydrogenase [Virgibacillus natechei]